MRTWFVTLIVAAASISASSICVADQGRPSYHGRSASRGPSSYSDGRVGLVAGSWLEACEGEPQEYGLCNAEDEHVRCFELRNMSSRPAGCDISMKASMTSPTGYERLYTANEHVLIHEGDGDWICFSYDEILESTGGNAWQWSMAEVHEPEISCRERARRGTTRVDDPQVTEIRKKPR